MTPTGMPDQPTMELGQCRVTDYGSSAHLELALRLTQRDRFDMETSKLVIYTGSKADGYAVSFAAIEAAMGGPFRDGLWNLARIPTDSLTVLGSPSWAAATGVQLVVTHTRGERICT